MKLGQNLKNIILSFFTILILLFFCEISYRVYEYSFYRRQLRKQDTFILQLLPNDQSLQYKLKPNSSWMFADKIPYTMNSIGLRDFEVNNNFNNTYLIVVLGDSYTFGWGVEMQDSYPKVIELILNNHGYNVRVVNVGIYGYNTQQEVTYFKKEISKYLPINKPNLVIIGFTSNDTKVQGVIPRHPYINHCESYTHSWFIEFVKARTNRLINKNKTIDMAGFAKSGDFYPIKVRLANPFVVDADAFKDDFLGWRRCKDALLEMSKMAHERNFDLHLVLLPDFSKDFKHYSLLEMGKKVSNYCGEIGIRVIDLFPLFDGMDNQRLQNTEFSDSHPNKQGQRLMGEALAKEILNYKKDELERYKKK